MAGVISTKRCCVCKETKPLTEFFAQRAAKDGRQAYCKACDALRRAKRLHPRVIMAEDERKAARRASAAKWRANNPDRARAAVKRHRQTPAGKEAHRLRARKYAAQNRSQGKERSAQWREQHPDRAVQSHRIHYLKKRDTIRASNKAYRLANLDAYREYGRQYKAAKRAGGGRLLKGYLERLMTQQCGCCVACQCDLRLSGHHVDHIKPISKGGLHCDDNIQLLCPTCNRRKSAKDFGEFLAMLKRAA